MQVAEAIIFFGTLLLLSDKIFKKIYFALKTFVNSSFGK